MTRRLALAVAVAVALVGGLAPPAVGQTSGGGALRPDVVIATASDFGAGTFPGPGLPAVAPAIEPQYSWSRTTTGAHCVVFSGAIPSHLVRSVVALPGIEELPGSPVQVGDLQGAPPGAVWLDGAAPVPLDALWSAPFAVDAATPYDEGPARLVVPRCAGPSDPGPPPDPPSAATIWQRTPLPRARLEASPPGTAAWPGIVNLDSRFWNAPLPDAGADVTLDGYLVSVTARPIAFAWSFGNGATVVSDASSSSDHPAQATYRRRGDYGVILYVVWAGVAHMSAPAFGLDLGQQDLGTVTVGEHLPHHVAEIRALLRSTSARG